VVVGRKLPVAEAPFNGAAQEKPEQNERITIAWEPKALTPVPLLTFIFFLR
jgi:hypothetical protein